MKLLLGMLWIIVLLNFLSCTKEISNVIKDEKISFNVDSFEIYNAIFQNNASFTFSPFKEKDNILIINNGQTQELDLKSRKLENFKAKYKFEFKNYYGNETIWKDMYSGDVYWKENTVKLSKYNIIKKDTIHINLGYVNDVLFRPDRVLLGTDEGLYDIDRISSKTTMLFDSICNERINSIENYTHNYVMINGNCKRYVESKMNAIPKSNIEISQKTYRYSETQNTYGPITLLSGSTETWCYDNYSLHFSKDKQTYFTYSKLPKGRIIQLCVDDNNVYIMFLDKFVIIDKDFIFKTSSKYTLSKYYKLNEELNLEINKMQTDSISLNTLIDAICKIQQNPNYQEFEDLSNRVNNLNYILNELDLNGGKLKEAKLILESLDYSKSIKFHLLCNLSKKYTISGDLEDALKFYNEISRLDTIIKDRCIEISYKCVKETKFKLDSLRQLDLPQDEYLYYSAEIKLKYLIQCSCWFGDSYYVNDLAEEDYKKLLSKHPTSKYASEADYWLLLQNHYDMEGGGFSVQDTMAVKRFIQKYPASKYTFDLQLEIINSILLNINSEKVDEVVSFHDIAMLRLNKLRKQNNISDTQTSKIDKKLYEIEQSRLLNIFDLQIYPKKKYFTNDEDVIVDVVINNKTSVSRKVEIFKNNPSFPIIIYPNKKVNIIESSSQDCEKVIIEIGPNMSFKQTINLTSKNRNWNDDYFVKNIFKKDVRIYVSTFINIGVFQISSKQNEFWVMSK